MQNVNINQQAPVHL